MKKIISLSLCMAIVCSCITLGVSASGTPTSDIYDVSLGSITTPDTSELKLYGISDQSRINGDECTKLTAVSPLADDISLYVDGNRYAIQNDVTEAIFELKDLAYGEHKIYAKTENGGLYTPELTFYAGKETKIELASNREFTISALCPSIDMYGIYNGSILEYGVNSKVIAAADAECTISLYVDGKIYDSVDFVKSHEFVLTGLPTGDHTVKASARINENENFTDEVNFKVLPFKYIPLMSTKFENEKGAFYIYNSDGGYVPTPNSEGEYSYMFTIPGTDGKATSFVATTESTQDLNLNKQDRVIEYDLYVDDVGDIAGAWNIRTYISGIYQSMYTMEKTADSEFPFIKDASGKIYPAELGKWYHYTVKLSIPNKRMETFVDIDGAGTPISLGVLNWTSENTATDLRILTGGKGEPTLYIDNLSLLWQGNVPGPSVNMYGIYNGTILDYGVDSKVIATTNSECEIALYIDGEKYDSADYAKSHEFVLSGLQSGTHTIKASAKAGEIEHFTKEVKFTVAPFKNTTTMSTKFENEKGTFYIYNSDGGYVPTPNVEGEYSYMFTIPGKDEKATSFVATKESTQDPNLNKQDRLFEYDLYVDNAGDIAGAWNIKTYISNISQSMYSMGKTADSALPFIKDASGKIYPVELGKWYHYTVKISVPNKRMETFVDIDGTGAPISLGVLNWTSTNTATDFRVLTGGTGEPTLYMDNLSLTRQDLLAYVDSAKLYSGSNAYDLNESPSTPDKMTVTFGKSMSESVLDSMVILENGSAVDAAQYSSAYDSASKTATIVFAPSLKESTNYKITIGEFDFEFTTSAENSSFGIWGTKHGTIATPGNTNEKSYILIKNGSKGGAQIITNPQKASDSGLFNEERVLDFDLYIDEVGDNNMDLHICSDKCSDISNIIAPSSTGDKSVFQSSDGIEYSIIEDKWYHVSVEFNFAQGTIETFVDVYGDGNPVSLGRNTFSANAGSETLYIYADVLGDDVSASQAYIDNIVLSGINYDYNGMFEITDYTVKKGSEIINPSEIAAGDEISFEVSFINKSSNDKAGKVYFAAYENNKLVYVNIQNLNIKAGQSSVTVSSDAAYTASVKPDRVRAFVWNENCAPYFAAK